MTRLHITVRLIVMSAGGALARPVDDTSSNSGPRVDCFAARLSIAGSAGEMTA